MRIYAKKLNRMLRIPIKRTIFAEQKCVFMQVVSAIAIILYSTSVSISSQQVKCPQVRK